MQTLFKTVIVQESTSQTSQALAEQLKHCERKCKQSESQRAALEDRLRSFLQKEKQWKMDAEKMKVILYPKCCLGV